MNFCRLFDISPELHPSRVANSPFMSFVRNGTGPRW